MSDINSIVFSIFEEVGYAGVEMYNDKYPAQQDDGGRQTSNRHQGDPNISYGGSNDFAKHEGYDKTPKMGKPNLGFIKGKNPLFSRNSDLPTSSLTGKSVLKFGNSNNRMK